MDLTHLECVESRRLLLRKPQDADGLAIFQAYTQDPEVSRYMIWRPHTAVAESEAFIADGIRAWGGSARRPHVLVLREAQDLPIGMLDARLNGSTVDIGYVLARAHWGKALMPEAIAALAEALLARPSVFRIQATCDVDNIASTRALAKAGFVKEGRLERYIVHPNISPDPRPCFAHARWR